MKTSASVTLPNGLWLAGEHHRYVGLRPLTGEDEAFLLDSGDVLLPVQRTTALLTRCVAWPGNVDATGHSPEAFARMLTVGDREALLLHLRRLTLGERLECLLRCPADACGETMDLELKVANLLLPPYSPARPDHEATIGSNGSTLSVRFRLPTGEDQEKAAMLSATDSVAAGERLLRSCLLAVSSKDGQEIDMTPNSGLPEVLKRELPPLMAQLDPQAELVLQVSCPECGEPFSALFDTASFFFREIANRSAHLYREVHLLAATYHWSEADIMGLTAVRRRRYLDLIDQTYSEM